MADITIQINDPTLTAGQTFRVRYRAVPGAFGTPQTETNAPFTLTGLTAGAYELEVVLVNADETECPATYRTFTVLEEAECIDFTVELIQDGSLFYISISYVIPVTQPPCGWIVKIDGTSHVYPTLPTSPILIPATNAGHHVVIQANGCSDNVKNCYDEDIPAIEPVCTPMVIGVVTAAITGTYPNGDKAISITFPYTQSSPVTKYITFSGQQKNVLSGTPTVWNYPNFSFGPIPSSGTPTIVQNVAANHNVFDNQFTFDWLIVDGCGQTHSGTVTV